MMIGRLFFQLIKKKDSIAFKICFIPKGRVGWCKGWVLWQRGFWDRFFAFLGRNSFHPSHNGTVYNTLHFKYFVKCEICKKWRLRNPKDLFWRLSRKDCLD